MSNMSRKDYESIAAAIVEARALSFSPVGVDDAAFSIADALCASSDSFNPMMFLRAAGVEATTQEIAEYSQRLNLRVKGIQHRSAS